jgi:hypothetical protein
MVLGISQLEAASQWRPSTVTIATIPPANGEEKAA